MIGVMIAIYQKLAALARVNLPRCWLENLVSVFGICCHLSLIWVARSGGPALEFRPEYFPGCVLQTGSTELKGKLDRSCSKRSVKLDSRD